MIDLYWATFALVLVLICGIIASGQIKVWLDHKYNQAENDFFTTLEKAKHEQNR